jgi:hypothetical protein
VGRYPTLFWVADRTVTRETEAPADDDTNRRRTHSFEACTYRFHQDFQAARLVQGSGKV